MALSNLLPNTTYYWQVRATNYEAATYADGSETAFWSFKTKAQPLTFRSTALQDGWILESTETSNKGGTLNSTDTTFKLGDAAADKQYRSILSFNTDRSA